MVVMPSKGNVQEGGFFAVSSHWWSNRMHRGTVGCRDRRQSGCAAMLMVGSHKAGVRRTHPGLPLGCKSAGWDLWNSLAGSGIKEEITS